MIKMCADCFESNIMGFSSQNDFDNFIRILDKKVKNQKIKINFSLEEMIGQTSIQHIIEI